MAVNKQVKFVTTVRCPDDVWTQYGDSQEFDRMFCEATKGAMHAEIDRYGDVEMSAEYPTTKLAEEADNKLHQLVRHFQNKLKEREDGNDE